MPRFAPKFTVTPRLLGRIAHCHAARAGIAASAVDVPWLPRAVFDASTRQAHASTSIEGNPLTLEEVRALADASAGHGGRSAPAPERMAREVLNYLAALRWITRHERERVDESRFLQLHWWIMDGLLPPDRLGRYKPVQNYVVDTRGEVIHTPPGPAETPGAVQSFLSWLNAEPNGAVELDPVITAGIVHYEIVRIHPFADGNGRVARAVETWMLYQRGFDTHHILALDEWFLRDLPRYYGALRAVADGAAGGERGDLTEWLDYVAEGVETVLEETRERILALRVSGSGERIMLTRRQEQVLRLFQRNSVVAAAALQSSLRVSREMMRRIVAPLTEAGLLAREGKARATRYRLVR